MVPDVGKKSALYNNVILEKSEKNCRQKFKVYEAAVLNWNQLDTKERVAIGEMKHVNHFRVNVGLFVKKIYFFRGFYKFLIKLNDKIKCTITGRY